MNPYCSYCKERTQQKELEIVIYNPCMKKHICICHQCNKFNNYHLILNHSKKDTISYDDIIYCYFCDNMVKSKGFDIFKICKICELCNYMTVINII